MASLILSANGSQNKGHSLLGKQKNFHICCEQINATISAMGRGLGASVVNWQFLLMAYRNLFMNQQQQQSSYFKSRSMYIEQKKFL